MMDEVVIGGSGIGGSIMTDDVVIGGSGIGGSGIAGSGIAGSGSIVDSGIGGSGIGVGMTVAATVEARARMASWKETEGSMVTGCM